ncbi:MAG TPA: PEP/pyruvate-binding domain-containing protein [Thermoanaerobaculia bacterium]|jgi:CheY-like chemotaxis protein|nr:PEP/pyruvate-binding domain-containing protein [Thermoanaerobaculia bacterium]
MPVPADRSAQIRVPYQDLMRHRIMHVLLVATPYDRFLLEEAGELSERMLGEFRNLDVHYAPGLTGVSTGAEALELVAREERINLIITTPRVADMDPGRLAAEVKAVRDVPVVLLAWDPSELNGFGSHGSSPIDRAFLWQGDARILQAIVKSVEDWRNVEHDSRLVGVQVILLIEDNVRHYSSFLPLMYSELLEHSQRVIAEGLNLSQKILRMRARPKVLLCTTFEEARRAFDAYAGEVLGIISDVEFPLAPGQAVSTEAGLRFTELVRTHYQDIPIVLHSSKPENEKLARQARARFLLKGSAHLLEDLHKVMIQDFGFGPFIFRRGAGAVGSSREDEETEVDRADDLRSLEEKLKTLPAGSLLYHGKGNHFSRWLKARTEFALAHALRPRKLEDYGGDPEALRADLVQALADYRFERSQTVVADFDRATFDLASDFYRIGGGSLGGKARGLAFVRRLISLHGLRHQFQGVRICIPTTAVLGTDVSDRFLDDNDLRSFAIDCQDDEELWRRFESAPFPAEAERDLTAFLAKVRQPLAVRSSSLLEDSQNQPFTGVYDTLMVRNNDGSVAERVRQATLAVKRVWASAFSQQAKAYLQATAFRLEAEKMAVMLQCIVGAVHGPRFYPEISGVARSYNFYPLAPAKAADGIAAVALGLGRAIVEGGACLRFCPLYPQHVPQLSSVREALETTQREFWALRLEGDTGDAGIAMREELFGLAAAETDGTLGRVASTYSKENDVVYDGLSRRGTRLVTFSPILKHGLFPLPEILRTLMAAGEEGVGSPVEIEFAVNLSGMRDQPAEFGFLQVRPLALARETEAIEMGEVDPGAVLCRSAQVLGNGRIEGLRDLVVVDFQRFERAQSREAAKEIGRLNGRLLAEGVPYVLIGVGRWGSRDPWLGIPVSWDQVAGAKVIVEAGLRDLKVTPSQGSHFFQNLTSFNVGYFTVNAEDRDGRLDWDWLEAQPAESTAAHVRHLRLAAPLLIKMNGRKGEGVILKPLSS